MPVQRSDHNRAIGGDAVPSSERNVIGEKKKLKVQLSQNLPNMPINSC
jgi:hypothetical protein